MSESAGSVNVPVVAAGAAVSPGDVIVADDDGVVVVPRDEAASVMEAIQQRLDKESATRARFEAGELGVDSCWLRDTFSDLSVHCRDET
jgi:4-hydroxy-4-methyl-2-oxoglutarate aldolase